MTKANRPLDGGNAIIISAKRVFLPVNGGNSTVQSFIQEMIVTIVFKNAKMVVPLLSCEGNINLS